MLENTSSFVALVKRGATHDPGMCCCTDCLALVSKTWPIILKEVFSAAIKVVSFIRARSLKHHFFGEFWSKCKIRL